MVERVWLLKKGMMVVVKGGSCVWFRWRAGVVVVGEWKNFVVFLYIWFYRVKWEVGEFVVV